MDPQKFDKNEFYHIYNHGVGNELLFKGCKDYEYFISKMIRFINPFCNIIAYCLLPNHFHFLIKINVTQKNGKTIEHAIKDFFNSYSRSFNSIHKRRGKLFCQSYKYKRINSEEYLKWIIFYIHRNPVHHNIVLNCEKWRYSSYGQIINEVNLNISEFIFELFGSREEFIHYSKDLTAIYINESKIM